jgi:hypothetical protein
MRQHGTLAYMVRLFHCFTPTKATKTWVLVLLQSCVVRLQIVAVQFPHYQTSRSTSRCLLALAYKQQQHYLECKMGRPILFFCCAPDCEQRHDGKNGMFEEINQVMFLVVAQNAHANHSVANERTHACVHVVVWAEAVAYFPDARLAGVGLLPRTSAAGPWGLPGRAAELRRSTQKQL